MSVLLGSLATVSLPTPTSHCGPLTDVAAGGRGEREIRSSGAEREPSGLHRGRRIESIEESSLLGSVRPLRDIHTVEVASMRKLSCPEALSGKHVTDRHSIPAERRANRKSCFGATPTTLFRNRLLGSHYRRPMVSPAVHLPCALPCMYKDR